MKHLHIYRSEDTDELALPGNEGQLSASSPAQLFLTDFARIRPLVIHAGTTIDEVRLLMRGAHLGVLSVLNSNEHFIGIITAEAVTEQRLLQKLAEGFKRSEVFASDLMLRSREIPVLEMREVEAASISDVIKALQISGQKYCLAVDRAQHEIRGIFSAAEIAENLHKPIDIPRRSDFYRVFAPVSYPE